MYSKIIVPLDGSLLAEKALSYAANLTWQFNATLVLLRIEEARPIEANFSQSPRHEAGNRILHSGNLNPEDNNIGVISYDFSPLQTTGEYETITSYAGQQVDEDYLEKVKESLLGEAAQTPLVAGQVETLVVTGRSPKELAAILKEEQANLVVMTTHGRSGLSLLLTGSVAANLIHHSNLPVILIKPGEVDNTQGQDGEEAQKQALNSSPGPIVVSLDGTAGSEKVLDAAANLAHQLGVKIHLFEVVQSVIPDLDDGTGGYYYLPDYDEQTKDLQRQAKQYLKEIQTRLRERGVESIAEVQMGEPTITFVYNGEPISRIVNYARKVKAQLVAMTTHGRDNLRQVVLGSVAEEVVRQSHLPVLLIRKDGLTDHKDKNRK